MQDKLRNSIIVNLTENRFLQTGSENRTHKLVMIRNSDQRKPSPKKCSYGIVLP